MLSMLKPRGFWGRCCTMTRKWVDCLPRLEAYQTIQLMYLAWPAPPCRRTLHAPTSRQTSLPYPRTRPSRFICNHASKLVVSRLTEHTATPGIQLRNIADDLIARFVSPGNLVANRKPEAALHRADRLVDAFGVQPCDLLAHFVIPGWEDYVDGDAAAAMGLAPVAKAARAADRDRIGMSWKTCSARMLLKSE
ncbi:hypothetical protein BC830DRAFT_776017 [Chytriomyces sp. MP71]|nr:hypothetical protein BC830DRAFT_776017 [Chytriomyces sp. MP71]